MPKTPRLGWEYPQEDAKSWWDTYESLLNQQETDVLAALEESTMYLTGGGTVTVDPDTDILSWSAGFSLISFANGGIITIDPGTLSGFVDGSVGYVDVARPLSTNSTKSLVKGTSSRYVSTRVPIVWRVRDGLVFRNNRGQAQDFMYFDNGSFNTGDVLTGVTKYSIMSIDNGTNIGGSKGDLWYFDCVIASGIGVGPVGIKVYKDVAQTELIKDYGSVALPFVDSQGFSFEGIENQDLHFTLENLSAGTARYAGSARGIYIGDKI
jgi:hypothetical protein